MLKFVRYINTLNIDTALGAVSFVFIVSFTLQKEVDIFIYFALILSVLSIYNLDHLIDAYRLNNKELSSFRHSFYKKNFKTLITWQVILLVVGVLVLFKLPVQVLLVGVVMTFLIGLYFYIIFKFRYKNYLLREVIIAAAYTFSVGVIPFMSTSFYVGIHYYSLLIIIFLIALTNLWFFAIYDYEVDKGQKHHSIARLIDKPRLNRMAKFIVALSSILIIAYFTYQNHWVLGISCLIIEMVYLSMLSNQSHFKRNEYYRLIGELILALPGFLLLIKDAV